ncbi:MAG: hypothetical protein RLY93_14100 [Sumerlaeia bacterium]
MAARTPQQTYYIVLPPQAEEFTGPMRPLSRLIEKDEAELAAILASRTYHVIRRFAKKPNAEGLHSQLHALGVESFIVSDTELNGALIIWAESANYGAGGMAVKDFGGQPLYCPFEDLICVTVGTVGREDGTTTQLLDFHRRSTPITPRIDVALFDFASFLSTDEATADDLCEELEAVSGATIDRTFDALPEDTAHCAQAVATYPSNYPPPDERLPAPYDHKDARAFDVYGFIKRAHLLTQAAKED